MSDDIATHPGGIRFTSDPAGGTGPCWVRYRPEATHEGSPWDRWGTVLWMMVKIDTGLDGKPRRVIWVDELGCPPAVGTARPIAWMGVDLPSADADLDAIADAWGPPFVPDPIDEMERELRGWLTGAMSPEHIDRLASMLRRAAHVQCGGC